MRTIGSVLDERKGVGPGFDFLRIALALSVLCTHSFLIAQGERDQFGAAPFRLLHASILPLFFALSGFLISGSAQRLSLNNFLLNRSIRIVPALMVDIVIAALILGPIFTDLSLGAYFSAYGFRAYFSNIFGLIHFTLPGVFDTNPFPSTVNGSLWTVPFEIGCYALMSAYICLGVLKRPFICLCVSLAVALYIWADSVADFQLMKTIGLSSHIVSTMTAHYWSVQGNELYVYFLIGSMFYVFRHVIPYHGAIFCVFLVCFLAGAFDALWFIPPSVQTMIFGPILVYLLAFIGLMPVPKLPLYGRGDYSYGIYLYGYPLQQALVKLFPSLTSPWLHMACSVMLATGAAMLSWHCIERPILKVRKTFSFTARKGDQGAAAPVAITWLPLDRSFRILPFDLEGGSRAPSRW